jgi:hypothetical protein
MRFRKEPMYLWNDEEETYLRSDTNVFFAKKKGGNEFKIDHATKTVVGAINGKKEVPKEEYDSAGQKPDIKGTSQMKICINKCKNEF